MSSHAKPTDLAYSKRRLLSRMTLSSLFSMSSISWEKGDVRNFLRSHISPSFWLQLHWPPWHFRPFSVLFWLSRTNPWLSSHVSLSDHCSCDSSVRPPFTLATSMLRWIRTDYLWKWITLSSSSRIDNDFSYLLGHLLFRLYLSGCEIIDSS